MALVRCPRMPRRIKFPFGYEIAVRYRTRRQLIREGLGMVAGAWCVDSKTLYVCRDEHIAEQCETVAHELIHAVNDYRHWVDQNVRWPLQQESAETALEMSEEQE